MPGSGKQKTADAEVSKILRENKQLKAKNEYFKKAAVYFTKGHK